MPRLGRDDDHVAGHGVDVLALDLVAVLAVVEDEDLGVRVPMATGAAAGDDMRIHDRCDEPMVVSGQLTKLTAVGRHGTLKELELDVWHMAGLHRPVNALPGPSAQ